MARNPGPNDFHFAKNEHDVLVIQPGLGKDEPDDLTKGQLLADAQANQRRQDALDRAARELAEEADTLERRQAELEEKERRLREWELKLSEAQAQSGAGAAESPRRSTARQATER